ncbi:preprotein translocase subunit YajC [Thermosyntropha sp.]|uniref:preprotein translocase subunit YajC n=1 Tax=Thermosyntropha sp. TaxID=2740820 RepID=UPI0025F09CC7|nr:preprotein translocase subunit YajC [Thermosyntropha sp.]MBO8159940.1 preprotein translocase subunit YajC [Thermosyntropha sp.]
MDKNATITLIIYFAGFIAIFYFFIIWPRKKQEKKHNELVSSLKKGDKIVTIGGIKGEIAKVKDETILVRVNDNTEVEFLKRAIAYKVED